MMLSNHEPAKIIKRLAKHESIRCDFCGYKIANHTGEIVIETFFKELIGIEHLQSVVKEEYKS